MKRVWSLAPAGAVLVSGSTVWAQDAAPKLDTGDTAWMLTSTALVLMMTTPGLALFYGGLVRSKNVLSVLMHSFFCAGLVGVTWVLIGYSLAFGPDVGGWLGGFDFAGLQDIRGTVSPLAPTIPHILFVAYQGTFAIITPALISGAFAERMRFPAFAMFVLLWSSLLYSPLAHWVWGGGWIATRVGALDFAGGTVVHIASGISALVTSIYVGKRLGHGHDPMPPHNLPFTVLGAGLLWVGWFGFNAGSALGSNELAALALINTNTAAAAASLGWLLVEWIRAGKPTLLGLASGAVAGLVAITPGAGFVTPGASIVIGFLGGMACYAAVSLKPRIGYDDALDVVGVHLVGGTLGALLIGVFATAKVNPAVTTLTLGLDGGLLYGHPELLWKQFVGVAATYGFCGVGTLVLLLATNAIFRVKADDEQQQVGLDLAFHSERAYAFGGEQVAVSSETGPRAALAPPVHGERFTVVIEGVETDALIKYWRTLCQIHQGPVSPEFRAVYGLVTTVDGNRFRFRGGDREAIRSNLEKIFRNVAPSATARIETGVRP